MLVFIRVQPCTPWLNDFHVAASPNPFNDVVYVQYRLDNMVGEEATLHVFDVLGRDIYNQKLQNTEGGVSLVNTWLTGIYTVQIKTKGRWSVPLKVVKTQ